MLVRLRPPRQLERIDHDAARTSMGLHLCYELSLPATFSEGEVLGVVSQLHACASTMGLDRMTPIVRVAPNDPVPPGGLAFPDLADFFRVIASIVEEPHDEEGYPVAPSRDTALALLLQDPVRLSRQRRSPDPLSPEPRRPSRGSRPAGRRHRGSRRARLLGHEGYRASLARGT